ncbi:hypothetical protein PybrP1_001735 [[Pythium] brassicae (nom. inval.)]|nr:hypothetical protein PybrP1_001735 [[Pythium] brassicae (nom. inval.)]
MGLHRVLNPELVLCGGCRGREDAENRWGAYATMRGGLNSSGNGAVLVVRDVCAAQACPELQVRGHLCVAHVRQAELTRQRCLPLRACSFCRRDVVQIYSAQQDVWFICAVNESAGQAVGAEQRETRPLAARRRKNRARRASRKGRSSKQKERLLALDWSLGNIPIKPMFLWKENRRRLEAEERRQRGMEDEAADNDGDRSTAGSSKTASLTYAYPDPTEVFCVVKDCRHFAKTGDRCRFHSDHPASFFLLRTAAAAAAAGEHA